MLFERLKKDIHRKQKNYVLKKRFFNRYVKILLQHGTIAVIVYRFGNMAYSSPQPYRFVLLTLFWFVQSLSSWFSGVYIDPKSIIGSGFVIHNFSSISIDAESIGENFTINQDVYVGESWERSGRPVLGNNVFMGCGSKILGPVTIGDNVVIAANSLVIKDVASNCIAVSIPALVISKQAEDDYIKSVPVHSV